MGDRPDVKTGPQRTGDSQDMGCELGHRGQRMQRTWEHEGRRDIKGGGHLGPGDMWQLAQDGGKHRERTSPELLRKISALKCSVNFSSRKTIPVEGLGVWVLAPRPRHAELPADSAAGQLAKNKSTETAATQKGTLAEGFSSAACERLGQGHSSCLQGLQWSFTGAGIFDPVVGASWDQCRGNLSVLSRSLELDGLQRWG